LIGAGHPPARWQNNESTHTNTHTHTDGDSREKRAHRRYGAHTLQDGEHTAKIANKYHPSGAIIGDWRYLIEIETDLEETKVESTDSSRHTLTRSHSRARRHQSPLSALSLSLSISARAEAERSSASRSDFVANSGQKCFTRTWHSALIAPTLRAPPPSDVGWSPHADPSESSTAAALFVCLFCAARTEAPQAA
jgi:hypothetical protein